MSEREREREREYVCVCVRAFVCVVLRHLWPRASSFVSVSLYIAMTLSCQHGCSCSCVVVVAVVVVVMVVQEKKGKSAVLMMMTMMIVESYMVTRCCWLWWWQCLALLIATTTTISRVLTRGSLPICPTIRKSFSRLCAGIGGVSKNRIFRQISRTRTLAFFRFALFPPSQAQLSASLSKNIMPNASLFFFCVLLLSSSSSSYALALVCVLALPLYVSRRTF